jgi:hypothetical protein
MVSWRKRRCFGAGRLRYRSRYEQPQLAAATQRRNRPSRTRACWTALAPKRSLTRRRPVDRFCPIADLTRPGLWDRHQPVGPEHRSSPRAPASHETASTCETERPGLIMGRPIIQGYRLHTICVLIVRKAMTAIRAGAQIQDFPNQRRTWGSSQEYCTPPEITDQRDTTWATS